DGVDDLYQNKDEIPSVYLDTLRSQLFALLEANAKPIGKKLQMKYGVGDGDISANPLQGQKDGDRSAVDAAISSLPKQSRTNPDVVWLIMQLQEQGSPELLRLLSAVVQSEELGQTEFGSVTLMMISGYFDPPTVPATLQRRFLKLVVAKSQNAAEKGADAEGFFSLISNLVPDISAKAPDMLAAAKAVQSALRSRVSAESREAEERNQRIDDSSDPISATVAEAEKTDDKSVKRDLYLSAVTLAVNKKRFAYAVDLVEKLSEIESQNSSFSKEAREREHEQFLDTVVQKALAAADSDAADYAVKKMMTPYAKASSFTRLASYYVTASNMPAARDSLDEAIKYANRTDPLSWRFRTLISLLPVAQKVDPASVFELNEITSKAINGMPALDVDDKPGTDNYRNYLTSTMVIDWNLLPALTSLNKVNRSAVIDIGNRLDRKEVRIIADLVLSTGSAESADAQIEKKPASLPIP
ncbi:MAG: hypothetical protein ACJ73D_09440, partial [Pyrinomonadaceae bacterium]